MEKSDIRHLHGLGFFLGNREIPIGNIDPGYLGLWEFPGDGKCQDAGAAGKV